MKAAPPSSDKLDQFVLQRFLGEVEEEVKAPAVWDYGFTGKGVKVAVLDSGVNVFHKSLEANILEK